MTTRVLKFKYTSDKALDAITKDIEFCGGKVKEKTKLLSNRLVYFTVEHDNSFVRKFRDTRSGNFLLN